MPPPPEAPRRRLRDPNDIFTHIAPPPNRSYTPPPPQKVSTPLKNLSSIIAGAGMGPGGLGHRTAVPPAPKQPKNVFETLRKADQKQKMMQQSEFEKKIDIGNKMGVHDTKSVREKIRQWQATGGGIVSGDPEIMLPPPIIPVRSRAGSSVCGSDREGTGGGMWESASEADREVLRERRYKDRERKMRRSKTPKGYGRVKYDYPPSGAEDKEMRKSGAKTDTEWEDAEDGGVKLRKAKTIVVPGDDGIRITPLKRKKTKRRRRAGSPKTSGGEETDTSKLDKAVAIYTGGYGADESNLTLATNDMALERIDSRSPPNMPLSRREELGLLTDPNFEARKPVMPEAIAAEPKSPVGSIGADDGIRVFKGDGIRVYASKRKKKRRPETETEAEDKPKGFQLVDDGPPVGGDVPIVRKRSRRRRRPGSPTGTMKTGKTDVESLIEELDKAASEIGSQYGSQYDPKEGPNIGVVNISGWIPPNRPYSPESASGIAPLRTRATPKPIPLGRSPTKIREESGPQRQNSNLNGPRDLNRRTRQRPLKREESVQLKGPRVPEQVKLKKRPSVRNSPEIANKYDYNTKIEPLQFSRKEAPVAKFLQAKRSAENNAAQRHTASPPPQPAPLKIVKTFTGALSRAREESSLKRGESLKRSNSKSAKKLSVKYSNFSRKDLSSRLRSPEPESTDDDVKKETKRPPIFLKRDYSVTRKEEKELKRKLSKRQNRESSRRHNDEPPQHHVPVYGGYYGSVPPEQASAVNIPLPDSVPSSPALAATIPLPDSNPGSPLMMPTDRVYHVQQPAPVQPTFVVSQPAIPAAVPHLAPVQLAPIEPLQLPKPVVPVPVSSVITTTPTPMVDKPKAMPPIIPMVIEKPKRNPFFPFKLEPPPPIEPFPRPDVPLHSPGEDSFSDPESYLPPPVRILSEIPEEPSVLGVSILEPEPEEPFPQVPKPPSDDENAYIPPGKQLKRFSTIKDAKPMKVKKRVENWAARIAEEPYVDTFVPEQHIPHGYREERAKSPPANLLVFPSVSSRHDKSKYSVENAPNNNKDNNRSYETSSRGSARSGRPHGANSPYGSGASGSSRRRKHKHKKHNHGPKKPKLQSFIKAVKAELAGRSVRADEVIVPMSGSEGRSRSRSMSRGRSGTSCSTSSCSECKNCVDCMMSSVNSSRRIIGGIDDLAPPRMPHVHGRSGSRSRSRSRASSRGSSRTSSRAMSDSSRGRDKERGRPKMQAYADTVSDVSSKPKKKKKDKKKKKSKDKASAVLSAITSPVNVSTQPTASTPPAPAPPKVSPPPPPPPPPPVIIKPDSPKPGSPSALTRTATGTTTSETPTSGRPTVTPRTSMDLSSKRSMRTEKDAQRSSHLAAVPETTGNHLQVPMPERQTSKHTTASRKSNNLSRKSSRVYERMERANTLSHADLMTLCSVEQDEKPQKPKSIRSKKKRVVETVSTKDLLKTLVYEEERYRRELDTLVNDVVPAVIMAALDQTDNDIAKGLQKSIGGSVAGKSVNTLPQIMELSTVLNQLQRLHARIDATDISKLGVWSRDAVQQYTKYLPAWRQGFQEIIVSVPKYEDDFESAQDLFAAAGIDPETRKGLESRLELLSSGAETPLSFGERQRTPPIVLRTVVEPQEEKVDVAYLLKRPLVAIKRNAKFFQYLNQKEPSPVFEEAAMAWKTLLSKCTVRIAEEDQRIEDELASAVRVDQVRSFYSFKQLGFTLDSRNKHVRARDTFQFKMEHPFAGLVEQDVVFILRERKPPGPTQNNHEVLVCKQTQGSAEKSLLYPPFELLGLKARLERDGQTVHVRYEYTITDKNTGMHKRMRQMFRIRTSKLHVASDWARMFGSAEDIKEIVFEDELKAELEERRRVAEEEEMIHRRRSEKSQRDREEALAAIREEDSESVSSESYVERGTKTATSADKSKQGDAPARMDSKSTAESSSLLRRSTAVSKRSSTNPLIKRSSTKRTKSTTVSRDSSKRSVKSSVKSKYEDPSYNNGMLAMPTTTLNDIPELSSPNTSGAKDQEGGTEDETSESEEETVEAAPPPVPPHRAPSKSRLQAAKQRTKSPSISESLRIKPHIALKPPVIAPSKRPGVGRRNSSPLKHEYQPSIASAVSQEELDETEYDDEDEDEHHPRSNPSVRSHSGSDLSHDNYRTSDEDDSSSISSTSDGSEERSFKSLSFQGTEELKPPPAVRVDEVDSSDFTTTTEDDTEEEDRRVEEAKVLALSRQVSHRSQKSHRSQRSHRSHHSHHSKRSRKSIRDVKSQEELDEERDYAMPLMIIEPRNKLQPTRKLSIIKNKPGPDPPKTRPTIGLNGYATMFIWKDNCKWELELNEELRVRITFGKLELHFKREDDEKLLAEAQALARSHPQGNYEAPEIFTRRPTYVYGMPANTTVMSGSTGLDVSLANILDQHNRPTRVMLRCRNQLDAVALRQGFRNFTPPTPVPLNMISSKPIRTMEELEAEDAAIAATEVRRGWNALGRTLSFRSGPKGSIASSGGSSKSFSSAISNFVKKKRFFGTTTIDQSSAASDETSGSVSPAIQILDYDGSAPIINAVKATCYSRLAGAKTNQWVRVGPVYLTVFNRLNNPDSKRVIASIRKKNTVVFDRILDKSKFERTARRGINVCIPLDESGEGDKGWVIKQNYYIMKFALEREAAFVFGVVGRTDGRGY